MSTKKQELQICLGDQMFCGSLLLADRVWSFSSKDPDFLAAFPTGTLYSFHEFHDTDGAHRDLQQAINDKVAELLEPSA
jgi:hypothetical protein